MGGKVKGAYGRCGEGMMNNRKISILLSCASCFLATLGCGRTSSLLLERQARGPIGEEHRIARQIKWFLEPPTQTKTQSGLEFAVTYASSEYLDEFFRNRKLFGQYAGPNPYFPEQIVFYVKIANLSDKKLHLDPDRCVLLDDQGNQYHSLNPDYNTALAESKAPISTLTRGVLEEARPGYFGVGVPVGRIIGKPQQRFALLKMSSLQAGDLYPGVIYDGLLAFWTPHQQAKKVKLLLTGIKTDFNAYDQPQVSLEFTFEFTTHPYRQESPPPHHGAHDVRPK